MEETQAISMSTDAQKNLVAAVKEYSKRLFSFIRKKVNSDEDANDILQDVWFQFSNIWYSESIEQVGAWLFTVARNKITDKYRKKKTELIDDYAYENEEGEIQFPKIMISENFSPENEQLRNLFWDELLNALDELPENQKEVFIMNELEDFTLQEIADKTGAKLKTVISRKGYAVKHLRIRLQSLYEEFFNY
jgi:RNA polymerase sigma factor (sigma-70 family)